MSRILAAKLLGGAAVLGLFVGSLLAIGVTGPVVIRAPKLDLRVAPSAGHLRRDVEKLVGELSPRSYEHSGNLDRAAAWIAEEFRAAGLAVTVQEYRLSQGEFRNVVGFRRGLDPDAPVRIVGAHYDAFGDLPGADDNASGVAVLLELVRTLPAERPRRCQYFVAFSTEEPPLFGSEAMGSYVFARKLRDDGVDVDVMIALDLVGYFSDAPDSQSFPLPGLGLIYPGRGNFLAVVGDTGSGASLKRVKQFLMSMTDMPIRSFRAPASVPGVLWSDHWAFRHLGMPGVLITDTAFLRYPFYHTAQDTPDRLDYERMVEVVRSLHGIVWDRDVSP